MAAIALRAQQRNRKLELEAATAERERLKSQLNPHFLFNTLNNISSLAAFDPDATQTAIARLSDMLRYVLYEGSKPLTPLCDEVAFLEDYAELMRLRYTETLQLNLNFNRIEEQMVPPLLYISLLENAFKHGASSTRPCYIRVSLTLDEGWICFRVVNSLLSPAGQNNAGGVGLDNLRQRLRLLYKTGDYRLQTGVRTDLGIPFYEARLDLKQISSTE